MTETTVEFKVVFVPGWGPNTHFGREVADRCRGVYPTLAEARAALKAARVSHGGWGFGRFDILAPDGRRHSWQ